jgi:DNA-binding NtrC family response regulator
VVERGVIVSNGGRLALDLPPAGKPAHRQTHEVTRQLDAVIPETEWRNRERAYVLVALMRTRFRVSGKGGAAELLGINPATLTSRIKALGINKRDHVHE